MFAQAASACVARHLVIVAPNGRGDTAWEMNCEDEPCHPPNADDLARDFSIDNPAHQIANRMLPGQRILLAVQAGHVVAQTPMRNSHGILWKCD